MSSRPLILHQTINIGVSAPSWIVRAGGERVVAVKNNNTKYFVFWG
ncbi:MAG: hypothetical protein ACYDBH_06725 [Acidobacteriaceae bacterium]